MGLLKKYCHCTNRTTMCYWIYEIVRQICISARQSAISIVRPHQLRYFFNHPDNANGNIKCFNHPELIPYGTVEYFDFEDISKNSSGILLDGEYAVCRCSIGLSL